MKINDKNKQPSFTSVYTGVEKSWHDYNYSRKGVHILGEVVKNRYRSADMKVAFSISPADIYASTLESELNVILTDKDAREFFETKPKKFKLFMDRILNGEYTFFNDLKIKRIKDIDSVF